MFLQIRETIANIICPEQQTERRALERQLNIDALTGVANRRAFDLAAPAAIADKSLVFILFDANNFGLLNKEVGHETGDKVLKDLALNIRGAAEHFGSNRVFRLGGDEFIVICRRDVAGDIRDTAENLFGNRRCVSVVVSVSGTIGDTPAAADVALQHRKKIQKGKI